MRLRAGVVWSGAVLSGLWFRLDFEKTDRSTATVFVVVASLVLIGWQEPGTRWNQPLLSTISHGPWVLEALGPLNESDFATRKRRVQIFYFFFFSFFGNLPMRRFRVALFSILKINKRLRSGHVTAVSVCGWCVFPRSGSDPSRNTKRTCIITI